MNQLDEQQQFPKNLDELARRSEDLLRRSRRLQLECMSQSQYLRMLLEQSRLIDEQTKQLLAELGRPAGEQG